MRKSNESITQISESLSQESPKERLRKLQEEETRLVRGRFRNFENPGNPLRVQIKKFKDVPMFDKIMNDNDEYEIPLYVARHLNGVDHVAKELNGKINTCSYPVHGHKMIGDLPTAHLDNYGGVIADTKVTQWVRRYGFESLQFEAFGS